MKKTRLEAFSDGVIAIIITIMILELKTPHSTSWVDITPLFPILISYILSFIMLGIYWGNHHHLLHAVTDVNSKMIWANLHLLFWLSLVPFASGWMGENNFTKWPVIIYGIPLAMAGIAYYILAHALIKLHGKNSTLGRAVGKDRKGIISVIIYVVAIAIAFYNPYMSLFLYATVAAIWLIPDTRIEKKIVDEKEKK